MRSGKNEFWLVDSTRKNVFEPLLYSRKPYLIDWSFSELKDDYKDEKIWFSCHSKSYPNKDILERIPEAKVSPVPVKLIIAGDYINNGIVEKPDMYIQRYNDCLFINTHTETVYEGCDENRKTVRVPHAYRISNKLFPDIVEESGIVGVKIVRR